MKTVIPYPVEFKLISKKYFDFSANNIQIIAEENQKSLIHYILNTIDIKSYRAKKTIIRVNEVQDLTSDEAYKLEISENLIKIYIRNQKGLFYALQTLKQLLLIHKNRLFASFIHDYPAFNWRGLHLDVSRHFFNVNEIKFILDRMAELKLNIFHWHLTDDQGWRIESKVYPLLNEISAKRIEEDGNVHHAFYTHDEIKDIVSYAERLMITVVPEIDVPGHTQSVIAAYPELSCFNDKVAVWNGRGVSETVLCAGKQEVFTFLETLFSELIPLFKGEYFHIGGDECPTTFWEKCPVCTEKVNKNNYSSYRELQSDINLFLSKLLKQNGKTLVGWDEIADSRVPEDSVLMCWRGDGNDAVKLALQNNQRFILSPNKVMYFDWKQSHKPDELGAFAISDLANVYNYNPHKFNTSLAIGLQANIWTERIETFEKLQYMTFPRVVALAENAWTSEENKDYNRFLINLKRFLRYYDKLNINYCKSNIENNLKYSKKKILSKEDIKSDLPELNAISSVFNPGVIKINNVFYMLLRVQNQGRETYLVRAESNDGKDFRVSDIPVNISGMEEITETIYHIYDPRLTYINDKIFVMTAMDLASGCYLGLFETIDLQNLLFKGIVSEADVRNGVIFPEKINNYFYRLERPNKSVLTNGTKTGSAIILAKSEDLLNWETVSEVFSGRPHYWDELIGSGPVPLKTRYGWLHIYHGVATHFASANIYQAGFSFLDLETPQNTRFRSKYNFLEPCEDYECTGQVPNVVFPTGLIALEYDEEGFVKDDSDLLLYYGCADTSIALLETNLRFFIEKMYEEKECYES